MEWKLFDGDVPHVSTFEFHEHRERAPHLEQWTHRPRLDAAHMAVVRAVQSQLTRPGGQLDLSRMVRVVDLGCGDGGLLSLLQADPNIVATGYDFQPSNAAGWAERGVTATALDFANTWWLVDDADVYVATEVLEHVADPHGLVRSIKARGAQLVCSSPWTEHDLSHDACHAWAWDMPGYAKMISDARFTIISHEQVGMFQVVYAV